MDNLGKWMRYRAEADDGGGCRTEGVRQERKVDEWVDKMGDYGSV